MSRLIKTVKSLVSSNVSYMILYVTSKCNSKCKTCFYWDYLNTPRKELTLEEIQKLTKSFKNLLYVSLTGGEPFLRRDIDEIIKAFYFNSGTIFFAIPTNALLTDLTIKSLRPVLKDCPEIRLHIDLSVDGVGELHDHIRGVQGNFEKMLKTHDALLELKKEYPNNLFINIHTCFNGYNQDKIFDIIHFFEKLDITHHRIGIARGDSRFPEALAETEKYKKVIEYMENNRKKPKGMISKAFAAIHEINAEVNIQTLEENRMILPCIAAKKMIVIGDEGDVYPCEILSKKLGNVRDFDLDINKLLSSEHAKDIRNWIVDTKCFCTWGCAIQNNVIFNPTKTLPKIAMKMLA